MSAQPTRQRRSFQEFTKMAVPSTAPAAGPATGESVIDLGAEEAMPVTPVVPTMQQDVTGTPTRSGLAPAGTAKATLEIPKATALPAGFEEASPSSMAVVADMAPSVRTVAPTLMSTPTPAAPVAAAPVSVAPAISTSKVAPASSPNTKYAVAAIALLAIGGAFAMTRNSTPEAAPTPAPSAPAPVVAAAAPVAQVETAPAPVAEVVAPVVETPAAAAATKAAPKAAGAVAAAPAAPVAPAAAKAEPAKPAVPAGPMGDLESAINRAAGPTKTAGDVMAESAGAERGNVPQRPSQGAVTGALRPSLLEAKQCLGPDDPVSRASVVFESTGKVQSVSISGAAAGTKAEGCIKNALMKTRVSPFADASYTTPVTIRP